jgi:kinesin family protein 4/21/27
MKAEMKRFSSGGTSVLKQHYEKKVYDLEQEKRALQREIEGLRHNLASIPSGPGDGAQKLKEEYVQKLNTLETQVTPVLFLSYTRLSHIIFLIYCILFLFRFLF